MSLLKFIVCESPFLVLCEKHEVSPNFIFFFEAEVVKLEVFDYVFVGPI
jgi:hypothetical protein